MLKKLLTYLGIRKMPEEKPCDPSFSSPPGYVQSILGIQEDGLPTEKSKQRLVGSQYLGRFRSNDLIWFLLSKI